MPVCRKCRSFVAAGQTCPACGGIDVEVTVADPLVATASNTQPMRPVGRPPTGILVALDDDSDVEGEQFRLRRSETSLGRRECDVCIANDADISALHAVILRSVDSSGGHHWSLRDKASTNGTFVRVDRWTFDRTTDLALGGVLLHWEIGDGQSVPCCLSELQPPERTFRLPAKKSLVIGRDAEDVDICLHHATVSPKHAEFSFDGRYWSVSDSGSLNGVWLRVQEYPLHDRASFMLGQQRFLFRCHHSVDADAGLSIEVRRE